MRYIKLPLLAILFFTLVSSTTAHDYYVCVTEIEHSEKNNSIQIISQIFITDFEKLLRERYDDTITLATKNESEIIETYMERYLAGKLKIKVDNVPVAYNFIGKKYKDDITYCYLEIENVTNFNTIEVTNRILFDVFPEQRNIVRLKLKGKNKSFLLLPENDKCTLILE